MADGTLKALPDSSCPQPKIDESVPCLPRHCLLSRSLAHTNATIGALSFIQFLPLPGNVLVRVRQRLVVLAGTNVTVVCPVRKRKQQVSGMLRKFFID